MMNALTTTANNGNTGDNTLVPFRFHDGFFEVLKKKKIISFGYRNLFEVVWSKKKVQKKK